MLTSTHMLVTARDRMAKLVKDGESEDDVWRQSVRRSRREWAADGARQKNFIRVVYHRWRQARY